MVLVFWSPTLPDKHYIWFLKFPLDEQGLLVQAARDEFLSMLLERVGESMLAATGSEDIERCIEVIVLILLHHLRKSWQLLMPKQIRVLEDNPQVIITML